LAIFLAEDEQDMLEAWHKAVPEQLLADLSRRKPRFAPGSVHVGFVVDKVALGQVYLGVLRFAPVNIIPPWFLMIICHLGDE
jgi:hypothetical protein